jgi:phenylalanyl-tRNA synthetase beta chain
LSDFQPLHRDFAFVVERDVAAGEILRAAQNAERNLIAGVDVFDVYEGPGIEEGRKSVGIEVTLQPKDKTLTDAEIEAVSTKIVEAVAKRTGAVLRA